MGLVKLTKPVQIKSEIDPMWNTGVVCEVDNYVLKLSQPEISKLTGKKGESEDSAILPSKIPANQMLLFTFGTICNRHNPVLLSINPELLHYCDCTYQATLFPTKIDHMVILNITARKMFDLYTLDYVLMLGVME